MFYGNLTRIYSNLWACAKCILTPLIWQTSCQSPRAVITCHHDLCWCIQNSLNTDQICTKSSIKHLKELLETTWNTFTSLKTECDLMLNIDMQRTGIGVHVITEYMDDASDRWNLAGYRFICMVIIACSFHANMYGYSITLLPDDDQQYMSPEYTIIGLSHNLDG